MKRIYVEHMLNIEQEPGEALEAGAHAMAVRNWTDGPGRWESRKLVATATGAVTVTAP